MKTKLANLELLKESDLLFFIPTVFFFLDHESRKVELGVTFIYYTLLITINTKK